jgi:hypothetical protein
MLLAGYACAHMLTRVRRPAVAVAVHLLLVGAAGLTLPLSIARGWGDPPAAWAALWQLGLFAVSIGPPFFALAVNAPLLQAWFARTDHPAARDPYVLYAASNLGSILALVAYPLLIEPSLTLHDQSRVWSGGFGVLFGLLAGCGCLLAKHAVPAGVGAVAEPAPSPGWPLVARWIFLAAVPSGLLVAMTAYISAEVVAAPLLWVAPLSLYLLTFVVVFGTRPLLPQRWTIRLLAFAIAALVAFMTPLGFGTEAGLALSLSVQLTAFFVIALANHGELSRLRPPAEHLTIFYMSLSGGGMVGGLFAGLIAPNVFSSLAEFPILITLAAFCLPFAGFAWARRDRWFWAAAALLLAAVTAKPVVSDWMPDNLPLVVTLAMDGCVIIGLLWRRDPLKFAVAVALAFVILRLYPVDDEQTETVRSFFGVHKVYVVDQYRLLAHGGTVHGAERIIDDDGRPLTGRPEPLTYYYSGSPLAQTIKAVRQRKGGPLRVAVVGLGTGSLACYREPGDDWRFLEIDPAVVAIARDPRRFRFLQSCAPDMPIVLGDARLTLAREPDGHYDLIIVDAYASDAIPVHLATTEAMALYKSKLAAGGLVAMHISSRYFELASVIAGIAAMNQMKTWAFDDNAVDRNSEYILSSDVVVAARDENDIGALATDWKPLAPPGGQRVWTDDYSDLLGAMIRAQTQ